MAIRPADHGIFASAVAGFAGAAYFAGGSGSVSAVDKFAFPDDSRTTLATGLSAGRSQLAGAANSGTAAYFAGGREAGTVSTVNKFAFSDDSRTTLATGLSSARAQLAGAANSGTAAYFAGGYNSTTVDKFAFSDDSRTTLGTGLSAKRAYPAGAANSGTAAYFGGGIPPGAYVAPVTTVDKFAFSDDSRTTLGTGLSVARQALGGAANSGTAAYFAGGALTGGARSDTVDKFAFSDDSRTTLGTGLSAQRYQLAGTANSETLA